MIEYKIYNKSSLLVNTGKEKNEVFMRAIGGKWTEKTIPPGWIIPKKKEEELKKYIHRKSQNKYHRALSESEDDSESEDSDGSCEKSKKVIDPIYSEDLEIKKNLEKEKFEKEKILFEKKFKTETVKSEEKSKDIEKLKNKSRESLKEKEDDNPIDFYKTFKNNPENFKKINNILDDDNESRNSNCVSSVDSEGSSDDFPSPKTPKKRRKYKDIAKDDKTESYDELFENMRSLQRQIYQMKIENKKLKSKVSK